MLQGIHGLRCLTKLAKSLTKCLTLLSGMFALEIDCTLIWWRRKQIVRCQTSSALFLTPIFKVVFFFSWPKFFCFVTSKQIINTWSEDRPRTTFVSIFIRGVHEKTGHKANNKNTLQGPNVIKYNVSDAGMSKPTTCARVNIGHVLFLFKNFVWKNLNTSESDHLQIFHDNPIRR